MKCEVWFENFLKLDFVIVIFQGTYGALPWGHGIEIIAINYPSNDTLKAMKLTGDPNVPMNKITFKADLNKSFMLPIELQEELECLALKLPNFNLEEKNQFYDYQKKHQG